MGNQEATRPLRVLLTGGGTGGHIYPALALADRLKEIRVDTEFLYVGTSRGLESKVVKEHGLDFQPVEIEGFQRKISLSGLKYNMNSIKLFLKGIKEAKKIINDFQPDVVLGTGGYVSAPVCYAASKEHIPTIIHEQNSVAGLTNKFLASKVDAIAICFEEAKNAFKDHQEKIVFTGNPRAQEVALVRGDDELYTYGLSKDLPTVIIFGGSGGAKKINETFIDAYPDFVKKDYQVLFITGHTYYDYIQKKIKAEYPDLDTNQRVFIEPYVEKMPKVLRDIDLVVSRSGATSLAEFTALGVPSILIPSPNVTEDHQTTNAKSLVDKEAAFLIKEADLASQILMEQIDLIMSDSHKRKEMAKNAKALGYPNAADHLIQVMLDQINK